MDTRLVPLSKMSSGLCQLATQFKPDDWSPAYVTLAATIVLTHAIAQTTLSKLAWRPVSIGT